MTPCILDYIGCLGPLILVPFTMINLRMQPNTLFVYIIFLIINTVMNALLKSLIREHRPDGQIILDGLEAETGIHTYGMPSGHAQSVAYTAATLFLVSRSVSVLVCVSVIGILTLRQRLVYRRHTTRQLSVGVVIGTLVALVVCVIPVAYG